MPQKKLLVIGLFSLTVALSGCATDGNYYRSDVYSSSQVNQAQRVNTVEIIAINPAQVAVNNSENSDRARATGAILGAIAGAAIGNHNNHSTSSRVLGGLAGGAIGGLAGDAVGGSGTTYVDGVQLVYRSSDGQVYQSTQVGRSANTSSAPPSWPRLAAARPASSRTTRTAAASADPGFLKEVSSSITPV